MKIFKYLFILIIGLSYNLLAETVEEIYAIVNSETITKSEFYNAVNGKLQDINKNTENKVYTLSKKEKLELLDILIDAKLLLSKAKLKNYDVKNDVKRWVEEIKKQNNFNSDKDFETALRDQGIDMTLEQFLENKKVQIMQQRLIQEEVSRNINVDNSEIMDFFKNNKSKYMTPMTIELNCIFLNKEKSTEEKLNENMAKISEALKTKKFIDIAKKYSQLTEDPETNFYLGKFKKGDLNKELENQALKLKKDQQSNWIETENGWYIIQLKNKEESKYVEYKSVSGDIRNEIFMQKSQVELKKYIEKLKKNSHIEIFVKF